MNSEKIAISNEGISVKSPNETIYFRFAIEPLTFILFLIEFFISTKINTKNNKTSNKLNIKRLCRFSSLSLMKLLSINVKKVIKANEIVNIKITIINKFLFNRANII